MATKSGLFPSAAPGRWVSGPDDDDPEEDD